MSSATGSDEPTKQRLLRGFARFARRVLWMGIRIYLVLLVLMLLLENKLIFPAPRYPSGDWEPFGIPFEDVYLTSADGTRLTFIADHDGEHHIHSFHLPDMINDFDGEPTLTAVPEDPGLLEPQVQSFDELHSLVVDPADPWRVLYSQGGCDGGAQVRLHDFASGTDVEVAPDLPGVPVGFVDATHVAVLEVDAGCVSTGDLFLVDLVDGGRVLVTTQASAAAVRAAAPPVALSLVDLTIVGFA